MEQTDSRQTATNMRAQSPERCNRLILSFGCACVNIQDARLSMNSVVKVVFPVHDSLRWCRQINPKTVTVITKWLTLPPSLRSDGLAHWHKTNSLLIHC